MQEISRYQISTRLVSCYRRCIRRRSHRIFKYIFPPFPALLILQPFRHFTYITAHYSTLPSLYLCHSSFSNPFVASPTSQLIIQPFRRFTYITAHSPTIPLLHPRLSSFSNPSVASPTSQLILQPFRCFTYVTAHSPTLPLLQYVTANFPTLPLLHVRHSSFSNPSVA